MTYCIQVRKLALRMVKRVGIVKTSMFTNISRITLWRWKTKGIKVKKRSFVCEKIQRIRDILEDFLAKNPCCTAKQITTYLRTYHGENVSLKTVYRTIRTIGYSRKRARSRGTCKGDLQPLINIFVDDYKEAITDKKIVVSIDECGFTEKNKQVYGYSPVNTPVILKASGSWVHHTLLMAVFSDGKSVYIHKKGSVKRPDFENFIDALGLDERYLVIFDNASIHKKLMLTTNPKISRTPPYSPEYNPIELCFAKIKGTFRKLNSSASVDVPALITKSVSTLTKEHITNCFAHVWSNHINIRRSI